MSCSRLKRENRSEPSPAQHSETVKQKLWPDMKNECDEITFLNYQRLNFRTQKVLLDVEQKYAPNALSN